MLRLSAESAFESWSNWPLDTSSGAVSPTASMASNQPARMISPGNGRSMASPRSASTRWSRNSFDCGPKSAPPGPENTGSASRDLAADGGHDAVEQRLARVAADIGRRHVQRNHVFVEQAVRILEREAGELAIDVGHARQAAAQAQRGAGIVASRRRRAASRTQPRTRPLERIQPSRPPAAQAPQHHAGGVDLRGVDARQCRAGRTRPRPARRGTGAGSAGTA